MKSVFTILSRGWLLGVILVLPWLPVDPTYHLPLALHAEGFRDVFGRTWVHYLPLAFQSIVLHSFLSLGIGTSICLISAWIWTQASAQSRLWFLQFLDLWNAVPRIFWGLCLLEPTPAAAIGALALATVPFLLQVIFIHLQSLSESTAWAASLSLGATANQMFGVHVLPSVHRDIRLLIPSWTAQIIMIEAVWGFWGIGFSPSVEGFGSLLLQAREYAVEAPHLLWVSGIPLVVTILALQSLSKRPYAI